MAAFKSSLLRARVLTVIPTLSRSETMCCSIDLNVASPSRTISRLLLACNYRNVQGCRSHCCVCCEHEKDENGHDRGNYIPVSVVFAHTLIPLWCDMPTLSFLKSVPKILGTCRFLWHVPGILWRVPEIFVACAGILWRVPGILWRAGNFEYTPPKVTGLECATVSAGYFLQIP